MLFGKELEDAMNRMKEKERKEAEGNAAVMKKRQELDAQIEEKRANIERLKRLRAQMA